MSSTHLLEARFEDYNSNLIESKKDAPNITDHESNKSNLKLKDSFI